VGYECERGAVSEAGDEVADHTATVHTPTMTLKKCGFTGSDRDDIDDGSFVWSFVLTFPDVLRDLVPAVRLFQSFIDAFVCFSVAVFSYVFDRVQS
jgi:hypothetical protein